MHTDELRLLFFKYMYERGTGYRNRQRIPEVGNHTEKTKFN